MSELTRKGGVFEPSREGRQTEKRVKRSLEPAKKSTAWLFGIPAAATAVIFVLYWVPETRFLPFADFLSVQLSPLVSPVLASEGYPLYPEQEGLSGLATLVLILGAFVGWVAVRLPMAWAHLLTAPASLVTGLAAGLQLARVVPGADLQQIATAIVLLGLVVVLALRAMVLSVGVEPSSTETWRRGQLYPLAWYAFTGLGPIAVGRALFAEEARAVAARLPRFAWSELLETSSHVYVWMAGTLVGLLVWAVVHLLPPWKGRSLTAPVVALVLALGPGVAHVVPETQRLVQDESIRIQGEVPRAYP